MSALVPFDALQQMAGAMAKSGLFGVKSADQALALMLVAQAEGQHPATIAQDYDIIQGRAARKTHSVLARFQAAGGKVDWPELSDTKAHGVFSHPQGGSVAIVWTLDQARKIGLAGKDNWKNYPRAMLRARCIAEGVRTVYPAAIGGLLVAEEARDMAPAHPVRNMGPAVEVAEPDEGLLSAAEAAADKGTDSLQAWWRSAGKDARLTLAGQLDTLKARALDADTRALPAPADDFVAEMDAAEVHP